MDENTVIVQDEEGGPWRVQTSKEDIDAYDIRTLGPFKDLVDGQLVNKSEKE
jgi:hypothetical protein